MTPRPDPSDLASELVDGLLSGEEAARAAATPEVAARVEEIHRLRADLREVPPAPELPKARALAAAVEAGMDARSQSSASPGTGGGWKPWLAAAAILAVVVLGMSLFALRGSDNGDVTASSDMAEESSGDAAEDSGGGDSATGTEEEAPQSPREAADDDGESLTTDGGAGSGAVDLGTVADEEELAAAVAGAARSSQATEPDTASGAHPPSEGAESRDPEELGYCPQLSEDGDPARGESTLFATATLEGERVWVHLYPDGGGDDARLVATTSACVDVVDRTVPPRN